jgi:hypothetical protein
VAPTTLGCGEQAYAMCGRSLHLLAGISIMYCPGARSAARSKATLVTGPLHGGRPQSPNLTRSRGKFPGTARLSWRAHCTASSCIAAMMQFVRRYSWRTRMRIGVALEASFQEQPVRPGAARCSASSYIAAMMQYVTLYSLRTGMRIGLHLRYLSRKSLFVLQQLIVAHHPILLP